MAKKSIVDNLPTYNEYHNFLQKTDRPQVLRNADYYLEQYSYFKVLADSIPCAVYMLDYSSQEYLFISKSCKNITGYSSKEAVEMGQKEWLKHYMHPEDAKIFTNKIFIKHGGN